MKDTYSSNKHFILIRYSVVYKYTYDCRKVVCNNFIEFISQVCGMEVLILFFSNTKIQIYDCNERLKMTMEYSVYFFFITIQEKNSSNNKYYAPSYK